MTVEGCLQPVGSMRGSPACPPQGEVEGPAGAIAHAFRHLLSPCSVPGVLGEKEGVRGKHSLAPAL